MKKNTHTALHRLQKKFTACENGALSSVCLTLLYQLSKSNDPHDILGLVAESIRTLYPQVVISFAVAPFRESLYAPTLIYVHTSYDVTEEYLSVVRKRILLALKKLPVEASYKESFTRWLHSEFYFSFEQEPDAQKNAPKKVGSDLTIPFSAQNVIDGAIHVSTGTKNFFDTEKKEIIEDIVSLAVEMITNIQNLIAAEHSRFGDMLKSTPTGVAIFNRHGEIVFHNPSLQSIAPIKTFTMAHFYHFFQQEVALYPEYKENGRFQKAIKSALLKGEMTRLEEVPLGGKYFHVTILPVRDMRKNISGGSVLFHDVTRLKELDQMKTEFVSVASHQLRTPLAGMHWALEMMYNEDAGPVTDEQSEYLDELLQSNKRMITLVNELLNVSRIESGRLTVEPEPVEMTAFVGEVVKEARSLVDDLPVNLVYKKTRAELPNISLDPSLMHQVVHNLVANAIRYSPESKKSTIEVQLRKEKKAVLISVKDEGIGIPEDSQKNIFQKFFRAANAVQKETDGTGFGLYIAKMIVDLADGDIWFDSKEGTGTTFFVRLPFEGMPAHTGDRKLIN